MEKRSWFRLGDEGSQAAIEDTNVMIQPPNYLVKAVAIRPSIERWEMSSNWYEEF